MKQLDVFVFPIGLEVEMHVRLQNYLSPSLLVIELNGREIYRATSDIDNGVQVVKIDNLDYDTSYTANVYVTDEGVTDSATATFKTVASMETDAPQVSRFQDFWIAVGEPGAYSDNMQYSEVFGMFDKYKIRIKHAPYSPMPKIKNVVVQSWKDEDGDDVWLPRATGSAPGTYKPAVTHEAVEYSPVFVIYGDKEVMNSNDLIRQLRENIEGRWLKIWDEYTHMGYEGVYLIDLDDDPKFKRRNYDHIEFQIKFKINGTNIYAPFEGITI